MKQLAVNSRGNNNLSVLRSDDVEEIGSARTFSTLILNGCQEHGDELSTHRLVHPRPNQAHVQSCRAVSGREGPRHTFLVQTPQALLSGHSRVAAVLAPSLCDLAPRGAPALLAAVSLPGSPLRGLSSGKRRRDRYPKYRSAHKQAGASVTFPKCPRKPDYAPVFSSSGVESGGRLPSRRSQPGAKRGRKLLTW